MATKAKPKKKKVPVKSKSDSLVEELKNLALIGSGIVAGSMAGGLIDKVVKVDPAVTEFQMKSLARPLLLLTAGASAAFLKDKNMKLFATGVGASGIMSGVKVILKKDLLAGLGDFGNMETRPPAVFRDPYPLQVESYEPDLPELNAVYMPYPNPMDIEEQELQMPAGQTPIPSGDSSFIEMI